MPFIPLIPVYRHDQNTGIPIFEVKNGGKVFLKLDDLSAHPSTSIYDAWYLPKVYI